MPNEELFEEPLFGIDEEDLALLAQSHFEMGAYAGLYDAATYLRTLSGELFTENKDDEAKQMRKLSDKLLAMRQKKKAHHDKLVSAQIRITKQVFKTLVHKIKAKVQ